MIVTPSPPGPMHGRVPGEIKLLWQWAKGCSFPTRISHWETNKRTDCQLLTICHHWQPIKPSSSRCCLLFSLYLLWFQPIINPHSNMIYKYNCDSSGFVLSAFGIIPKEIITCYRCAAFWATTLGWWTAAGSSQSSVRRRCDLVLFFCHRHITPISQMCQI